MKFCPLTEKTFQKLFTFFKLTPVEFSELFLDPFQELNYIATFTTQKKHKNTKISLMYRST